MRKLTWMAAVAMVSCAARSPTTLTRQDAVIAQKGDAVTPKAIDAEPADPDACSKSDDQARALLDEARSNSERDRALYAAERYVDRMEHVATGDRRVTCFVEVERNVSAVISARCAASDEEDHDCGLLRQIDIDIERMLAEKDANDAAETNDPDLRRRAADRLFAIARDHCAGSHFTHRCDEIVYNAAVLYLRAGDRKSAEAARSFFRDPRNSLVASPLAAKLDCVLDPTDAATCR